MSGENNNNPKDIEHNNILYTMANYFNNPYVWFVGVIVIVIVILWKTGVFKSMNKNSTLPAGKPRRAMISMDSRGNQPPSAQSGRVRPYPCLFMPGGPTQQTEPICNNNIPWFPPYNRGTWPERFPGRFSDDYAPDYVAPLNERFYQSDITDTEVASDIDEKKATNSLLNSFARAPIKGAQTPNAGNEGFVKTDFSRISFPSMPGMYDLRSAYASPVGTVPQAQAARQSLAEANVGRTQRLQSGLSTPAHIESRLAGNADLMGGSKKKVPKELAHLSKAQLNAMIQDELESMECFKCDKPAELPVAADGYDPYNVDVNSDIHQDFMSQGRGVLSRYANKDVPDKVSNLMRHGPHAVIPTEAEMDFDNCTNIRPDPRGTDGWLQNQQCDIRSDVRSVLQAFDYPAYTNADFTDMQVNGQTMNAKFGP